MIHFGFQGLEILFLLLSKYKSVFVIGLKLYVSYWLIFLY